MIERGDKMAAGKEQPKRKAGRQSKYFTHVEPHLDQIFRWKQEGKYEEDICEALGVGVSAWTNYKNRHPELKEVLIKGNQQIGHIAERSLFDALQWQEWEETEVFVEKDKKGNKVEKIKKTKKKLPPNIAAIIFALKNKLPDEYSDRREVNMSGSMNLDNRLAALTDEELEELEKELGE